MSSELLCGLCPVSVWPWHARHGHTHQTSRKVTLLYQGGASQAQFLAAAHADLP